MAVRRGWWFKGVHVRKIDSYNLRMQERERSVSPSFAENERVMARIRADESAPLGNLAVVDDDGTNAHKRASADGRGFLYMLTFPDGMRYVGQTVDLEKRMESHRNGNKCPKVQAWKAMFGWGSVRVTVLERVPHDLMNEREIKLIRHHRTLWPKGLNRTPGGDGIPPDVVRESWRDPAVRKRHKEGRIAAWADARKRANIMGGRAGSAKVAKAKAEKKQNAPEANAKRSATWENKRDARLDGLVGKKRMQRLARLNRDRERHRRAVAKRTQVPPASATAVAHARTVRIGSAHECGIFEVDGFVYATILGEGVPC